MEIATERGSVVFESLWKTRYENLVPVKDMEDEHLINTIDYLERQLTERPENSYVLPFTELTQTRHNIEVLKRELIRRG